MDAITNGISSMEKRNRPPVSCEPCRTRKLKCDRGAPCDTCKRRDKADQCAYAVNASRTPHHAASRSRALDDRLKRLELLPTILMRSSSTPPPSLDGRTTVSEPSERLHLQQTTNGQMDYIDSSHWLSVLQDIEEIRGQLAAPARPDSTPDSMVSVVGLGCSAWSKESQHSTDLLSFLPKRPVCDMLLSWYFSSRYMVLGIVHPAKFQTEYAAFWASPSTSPPLWTALFLSVLGIVLSLRRMSNTREIEGSIPSVKSLHQMTVRYLVAGRYVTASEHVLEAFLLHLQSCFLNREGDPIDWWFEMGTIIRLAFRLGYHRDPSRLAGIPPFEGEMRRRLWLNIFQLDALMSFQMGFPSMIPNHVCDTQVPRNLEYADFYPGIVELPPSRPLSEQTHFIYLITKADVMRVFKKIAEHTQSLTPQPFEKTLSLDVELRQVYAAVPPPFQPRDIDQVFLDHPCLIWQRCTIELLYLKGLVVLHRRYIKDGQLAPASTASRDACTGAALGILARQADLHWACEPGGRLHEDRWMMGTLQPHDFLLAAMVVCLDLSVVMRFSASLDEQNENLAQREYNALQTSQQIWTAKSAVVPEARTAALALDLMLKKTDEKKHKRFASPDPLPQTSADADSDFGLSYADDMAQWIDGSESIDWKLMDQWLQGMDPSFLDSTT
ncbi:hypothetical protein ANO11243_056230 [Dothideomycetidae sp. 11243]|nr:hypothetical protein ANO11243_056230 [fungal sp. No.11243]